MTLLALILILTAAFLHAGWNLLAKRVGGGALFVWLIGVMSSLIYAPFALGLAFWQTPHFSPALAACVVATACLHVGYFVSLQRGYASGDMSLVYPLARGTGPMLATLIAIALFGERPGALALAGAALIIASVFVISGGLTGLRGPRPPAPAVTYGLITGVFIAGYTLLDKYAMSSLLIAPLIYDWLSNLGRATLLTPYALRRRGEAVTLWRSHRTAIIGVAIMSPMAYILILTAMVFTPVSYVAPAREVSILIGVLMSAHLLSEGQIRTRAIVALVMLAGIALLVLG